MSDLREKLAEFEHEQWIKWSQAIADEVSTSKRVRWEGVWIPYSELTEDQKDQDRVWADKAITAFKAHIEECEKTPTDDTIRFSEYGRGYFAGWKDGVNNDRKALMESLKTSD